MKTDRTPLTVVTYNIHKGFSQFNRRLVLHDIRDRLQAVGADIVFLQEVQGAHLENAKRHRTWPEVGQHEYLAIDGAHAAYGLNATHQHGHYGSAIVSRFPILKSENIDVSHHVLESRGLLHCEIEMPGSKERLHCINVHLGLWERSRRMQIGWLCERIREAVPDGAPLIVAGDFNDWRRRASNVLGRELGLAEAFECCHGRSARSFPARLPMFSLDRIYVRGLGVDSAQRLDGALWSRLSDHMALSATLTR